jgi:hypothetical protein
MVYAVNKNTQGFKTLGDIVPTDARTIVETISNGGRDYAPILLKETPTELLGVVGSQGFYRLGSHADGRSVLLFAENPHDLDPYVHTDPKFKDEIAPGFWLSNDPNHLKYIKVVEARRKRTDRPWVLEAINEHSKVQKNDKLDYGFLYRVHEKMWVSGAIAYELTPAKTRNPDDPDEEMYILKCYTTAGKGRPFSAINEGITANKIKGTMKLGAVSARVTMAEAEAMVREDFAKRVDLVMREIDPRMMGRMAKEPDMHSALSPPVTKPKDKARAFAATYAIRILQGAQAKYNVLKTPTIFFTACSIAYYVVSEWLIRGLPSAIKQGIFSGAGLFTGTAKKPVRNDMVDNAAHTFWKRGITYTGAAQYCPLDMKQAKMIGLMTYDDANIRPDDGAILRQGLEPDWIIRSLYTIHDSPPGSIVTMRNKNHAAPVHVKQPNGLEIYYMIDQKVRYARYRPDYEYSCIQPLPEPVKDFLRQHNGFVKIVRNTTDNSLTHSWIDEGQLLADMDTEAIKPTLPKPKRIDLSILNEFNLAAAAEAKPKSKLARGWDKVVGLIHLAKEKAGMTVPESRHALTPKQIYLEEGLGRRVPVFTTPAHPSSHTGQAAVSQPIAQP